MKLMSKYFVGQTVISKKDNKRCIIEYIYDNGIEGREYRVTFDVGKRMKILKEIDIAPVYNIHSTGIYRNLTIDGLEQEYIRKYRIYYLFHFTHRSNLDQILSKGLLPKNKLAEEQNKYLSIADEEVQEKRANVNFYLRGRINKVIHDCVPLYISWRTPTLYRVLHRGDIKPLDIINILVNTYSALRKNYCFTDGNAASPHTHQYFSINNLDKLDWDVIKSDDWGGNKEKKRKKNAEFLVYPKIEVKDFYKLIVYDNDVRDEINDLIKKKSLNLEVETDRRYYEWPDLF